MSANIDLQLDGIEAVTELVRIRSDLERLVTEMSEAIDGVSDTGTPYFEGERVGMGAARRSIIRILGNDDPTDPDTTGETR